MQTCLSTSMVEPLPPASRFLQAFEVACHFQASGRRYMPQVSMKALLLEFPVVGYRASDRRVWHATSEAFHPQRLRIRRRRCAACAYLV